MGDVAQAGLPFCVLPAVFERVTIGVVTEPVNANKRFAKEYGGVGDN